MLLELRRKCKCQVWPPSLARPGVSLVDLSAFSILPSESRHMHVYNGLERTNVTQFIKTNRLRSLDM